MSWLSRLPHQIPFRAASAGQRLDDRTIEGLYVCTANDPADPQVMLVEAMAQLAGGLVFENQGFFTGIDGCEVLVQIAPGDRVDLTVTLEAEFGGTFRFRGSGRIAGVEAVRGRFYLAGAEA